MGNGGLYFLHEREIHPKNIPKRKNGIPAFVHPLFVFDSLRGLNRTIRISALYHDVIEDGVLNEEELWILPQKARKIVLLLTRKTRLLISSIYSEYASTKKQR